ncbi:hypothetical protein [Nocardia sp. NPDC052566]|uniref:hypothetical protein n=1 Tax=Nocardia sp. NPDC052566 TaxID=3364330 RepID=UPI0037C65393
MSDVVLTINSGRDLEWLDEVTDELHTDLRAIGGLSVRRATAAAPDGTKSDVVTQIGQLVTSGGTGGIAVWAVRDVILRFLERTRATSITVKKGDREVTIARPTDKQVDKALEQLGELLADD